jgi:hypothetical protein
MGEGVEETATGPGCFCRIAREFLGRETDSRSLVMFCSDDYASCPTWQSYRDAEEADEERSLRRQIDYSVPRGFR